MSEWAQKIRGGDLRALARAASGLENRDPAALALLHEMEAAPGHALIVGVTGPPGAGKSTLVDAMATALRRQDAQRPQYVDSGCLTGRFGGYQA